MKTIHLAHGLLERDGRVLLVASKYPNHPLPLWNLPGGRRSGELLDQTVRREFLEETQLFADVLNLRYVAESFDSKTETHFVAFVFGVSAHGVPRTGEDAHVVDVEWVPMDGLRNQLTVPVVRDPLLTHLVDPKQRYFAYPDAGITIHFADEA